MPKLKTNKASAKRFKRSKGGKLLRKKAGARHMMSSKSAKRKRQLRLKGSVSEADKKKIKRLLPYLYA